MQKEIEKQIMQDIKDYVKSLNTTENEVYKNNDILIMSCFSKAMEIVENRFSSPSADSSEVSYSDVFDRFKKMNWEHEYAEMGIMNRNDFERAVDFLRSKLKSQWVSVDRKQAYSEANDLIVERLFRFYDLKAGTREAIIQAMIDFKFPESPIK